MARHGSHSSRHGAGGSRRAQERPTGFAPQYQHLDQQWDDQAGDDRWEQDQRGHYPQPYESYQPYQPSSREGYSSHQAGASGGYEQGFDTDYSSYAPPYQGGHGSAAYEDYDSSYDPQPVRQEYPPQSYSSASYPTQAFTPLGYSPEAPSARPYSTDDYATDSYSTGPHSTHSFDPVSFAAPSYTSTSTHTGYIPRQDSPTEAPSEQRDDPASPRRAGGYSAASTEGKRRGVRKTPSWQQRILDIIRPGGPRQSGLTIPPPVREPDSSSRTTSYGAQAVAARRKFTVNISRTWWIVGAAVTCAAVLMAIFLSRGNDKDVVASTDEAAVETGQNNGVEALPAVEIVKKAQDAAAKAGSVRIRASLQNDSRTTIDVRIKGTTGGGTVIANGSSVAVRRIDDTIYVQGSDAFNVAAVGPEAARSLAGKWLFGPKTHNSMLDWANTFDYDRQMSELLTASGQLTKKDVTTFGGQPVVELRDSNSTYYVATTGEPYVVATIANNKGADNTTIRFSEWGKPVVVDKPTDPLIDITQLKASTGVTPPGSGAAPSKSA